MYKEDLALDNLQWLKRHKAQPNYTAYIRNLWELPHSPPAEVL